MTDDVLFFCQLRLNPITGFVARKSIPKELNPEFSCCAASSTNSSYLVRVIWRMLVQHLWYELFVLAMFPLPIPLFLAHLRESGNPGLHPSVVSSCGWSHTIDVGWLIGWQGGGLLHPAQCPLCDQEEKTINHLLVSYVFARQFWFFLLQHFGIHQFCPQLTDSSFDLWWENSSNTAAGLTRKGFNSLVILGAWTLWNHRNRYVFDGATPSLVDALGSALEESRLWALAGARGLSFLASPPSPPVAFFCSLELV
jgi:hypothetical protein